MVIELNFENESKQISVVFIFPYPCPVIIQVNNSGKQSRRNGRGTQVASMICLRHPRQWFPARPVHCSQVELVHGVSPPLSPNSGLSQTPAIGVLGVLLPMPKLAPSAPAAIRILSILLPPFPSSEV